MQLPVSSFTDRAVKGLPQAQLNLCQGADPQLRALTDDVVNAVVEGWDPRGAELARRHRLGQVAHQLDLIPSEEALRGAAIHQLVTNHSPKLTKAQRRRRRRALLNINTIIQKRAITYKTYQLGIAKWKDLLQDAGEPGYDHPQFFERDGKRRKQRRVRGRLRPIQNQPQRQRKDLRAAA